MTSNTARRRALLWLAAALALGAVAACKTTSDGRDKPESEKYGEDRRY